ncbi:MAG: 5' nucleotidase, NT5C type [Chitinophagales bacterium]
MERVYVDMDNVLCDYTGHLNYLRQQDPTVKYPQIHYGFFSALKPMKGAVEAFKTLSFAYETYILTSPSYRNAFCYTEKRVWVEQYFDLETCKRLIISPNKSLLLGDYLIDDNIHLDFQGEHVHFGTPRYPDWASVLDYLMNK